MRFQDGEILNHIYQYFMCIIQSIDFDIQQFACCIHEGFHSFENLWLNVNVDIFAVWKFCYEILDK